MITFKNIKMYLTLKTLNKTIKYIVYKYFDKTKFFNTIDLTDFTELLIQYKKF